MGTHQIGHEKLGNIGHRLAGTSTLYSRLLPAG